LRACHNDPVHDDSQVFVPSSFVALFVPEGRPRPTASREEITARHEFCEALATLLVERAQSLQWSLGITEDDVLKRIAAGLEGGDAGVSDAEAQWVLRRLAELLEWERPFPRS
jgi:hypothetical protein